MSDLYDDIPSWQRQLPYGRYIDGRTCRYGRYTWVSNYHFHDNGRSYTLCGCGKSYAIGDRIKQRSGNKPSQYRRFIANRKLDKLSNRKSVWEIKRNFDPYFRRMRKDRWDD